MVNFLGIEEQGEGRRSQGRSEPTSGRVCTKTKGVLRLEQKPVDLLSKEPWIQNGKTDPQRNNVSDRHAWHM